MKEKKILESASYTMTIEMFYAINEKNLMYFTNLQNFNI